MADDFRDATERAVRATFIARKMDANVRKADGGPQKSLLADMRKADVGAPDKRADPDWFITEIKLEIIGTLHNIKGYTFTQIDTCLHFPRGTSAGLAKEYPKELKLVMRKDMDFVLDRFFRNKISILDQLMTGAPNTIKFLVELQADVNKTDDQRLKAGDRIFDWTRLILTTKKPEAAKRVLSGDLRKVADEADTVMEMFQATLGESIGHEEN